MSFWFCNLESNDSKEITFPEATPERIISKPGIQRKILNDKSPKRKNSKSQYNKLYQYRKKKEKESSLEKEKESDLSILSNQNKQICMSNIISEVLNNERKKLSDLENENIKGKKTVMQIKIFESQNGGYLLRFVKKEGDQKDYLNKMEKIYSLVKQN